MTRLSDLDESGPMECGCYRVEVHDFGHGSECPTRRPPDHGHGDPSQDPPGTCRWRNPADSGPWIKVAENRWVHVGGGGGQGDEVVAAWPIGTLSGEPLHEWRCPNCGATTRARMADAPGGRP